MLKVPLPIRGLICLLAIASSLYGCSSTEKSGSDLPNIVIIIADDLGWNDVSYHGGIIRTPNIDELVRQGVELNHFYAAPICTPTRSGLMTGRYGIRFGLARSVLAPWRRYGIDPSEVTLAEMLETAGYPNRGAFGKWHLGHLDAKWHPLRNGFTHFHGCYTGAIDYFTHERMGERDWHIDYEPSNEPGYVTELIAQAVSRFIEDKAGNEPFFCYVAFTAPHEPFEVPERYLQGYDNLQGNKKAIAGVITALDEGIGRILASIDAAGVKDNTIVWFLSDNGGIPEFKDNNIPLRGNKLDVFEGGVRVLSGVRWPRGLTGGRKVDAHTAYIDIFPTLMQVANVADAGSKPLDGISILDVLRGEKTDLQRDVYFYHGHEGPDKEQIAIVTPQWKLVILGPDITAGVSEEHEVLLFSIEDDPTEANDVSALHPDVVKTLTDQLRAFHQLQQPDAIPPSYVGRQGFKPPKNWRVRKE